LSVTRVDLLLPDDALLKNVSRVLPPGLRVALAQAPKDRQIAPDS